MMAVNKTKKFLYGAILDKKAMLTVPRPREAMIKLPPQQKAAKNAGNIEKMLKSFSFINVFHPLN